MATPKDSAPNEERITAKATSPVLTAVKVPLPITMVDVTSDDVPPFSLETERYDQSTYYGRFRKMLDVVDPRTLLCSQKEIDDAVQLLKRFETQQQQQNECSKVATKQQFDDAELWQAKKIRDAIFHPDTNEKLLPPFRMSGFLVRFINVVCRVYAIDSVASMKRPKTVYLEAC